MWQVKEGQARLCAGRHAIAKHVPKRTASLLTVYYMKLQWCANICKNWKGKWESKHPKVEDSLWDSS